MTSDNDRLRAVFLKRSKISQREFGERYGIGTAGMVNQLLLGRRPVSLAAAERMSPRAGLLRITEWRKVPLRSESRIRRWNRISPRVTS